MNHIYEAIWNEKTGTFIAASENQKAKGKRSASCNQKGVLTSLLYPMGIIALTASTLATSSAWGGTETPNNGSDQHKHFTFSSSIPKFVENDGVARSNNLAVAGVLASPEPVITRITNGEATTTVTRVITGVADGEVSSLSTDAINGSQLYTTNQNIKNVANSTLNIFGGNANQNDEGKLSMDDIGGTGENTIHDAIQYAAQGWSISTDGNNNMAVKPGKSMDFSSEDKNIDVALSDTGMAFQLAQQLNIGESITIGKGGPSITADGINMGGKTITNLAKGSQDNDAVTMAQLNEVSSVVNDGWSISVNGEKDIAVKPGKSIDFKSQDDNIAIALSDTGMAFKLAQQLNIGQSITIGKDGPSITADGINMGGKTITNLAKGSQDNDAVTMAQLNEVSSVVNDGWSISVNGEKDIAVKPGKLIDFKSQDDNIAIALSDTGMAFQLAQQLNIGQSITIGKDGPSITAAGINMSEKTITNLAKGSQDGDAVNMAQFKEISKTANYGWSISANGKASTNVNSGTSVDFSSKGDNISITPNANGLAFELSKDLNLGQDGSLTVGNTALNNEGLTVQDSASNKTSTTAWGTTVSNAAGDKTSVGAGSITVADAKGNTTSIGSTLLTVGGAHPVNINGETGRIGGLSNKTWNPDDYTSGQAATEDQLKHVSDIARSGWTATDSGDNSSTIGPKGIITFVGDDNIALEQTGTDNKAKIEVKLNKDLDLGTDGSVKTAGTLINSAGLTVGENVQLGSIGLIITNGPSMTTAGIHAGGMRISQVAAGISATDAVNYGQLQPLESFIPLDGKGSFAYNGGQHSTLKEVLDSLHWNVEAPAEGGSGGSNGSGLPGGGNSSSGQNSSIHNGNAVGFVQGDNIVISKTDKVNDAGQVVGADIKVAVAQDIKVNAVKANEIQINNGGPIINEQGIDMSGKRIANVAAGVNETDAVNVRQLQEATGGLQNQVSHIRQDVHRLDNRLSAGVAAAMATASLPQAYLPGKNMMSMAGGTWRGESGMAIGFSGITENGRWIYKLSGNSTSRGDYGGAVGVGYQW